MPLVSFPEAFDHPQFVFEPKRDGFRALAYIDGHQCRLVSRRGHVYKAWPQLAEELAHAVRARQAVLDGEIVCLEPDGRSHFYKLLFRRDWPHFMAFDLLWLNGKDLREWPLVERKRRLLSIMPRVESRTATLSTSRNAASICSARPASTTSRASWRSGAVERTRAALARPG